MKLFLRFICVFMLVLLVVLLSFRGYVYRHAVKIDSLWDDSGNCYIDTFKPRYSSYGGPGRVLSLISNEAFFIVYDKQGKELKNSANYFWQTQFSDTEGARWNHSVALYPTTTGWSGWRLPECG